MTSCTFIWKHVIVICKQLLLYDCSLASPSRWIKTCFLCWHAVLMPFMLAQIFGLNAGACALLTCILPVTLPLSSALVDAVSNETLRHSHVFNILLPPLPCCDPSWPQSLNKVAACGCCRHSCPQVPPLLLSSGQLSHPRRQSSPCLL